MRNSHYKIDLLIYVKKYHKYKVGYDFLTLGFKCTILN